ncbi:MAG: penicillin acylase family protein [Lewinellaceae bacterium]|nr:penicillin acylase family protein [Lewinellaceae bacterium]
MKHLFQVLACLYILLTSGIQLSGQPVSLTIPGLEQPVEIITDTWGIPHIYAQTEADLFFAQGYYAARDRLFQFEVWRRQATGTVAEILGPRELKRDIGARLFRFRGDMKKEMNHYHPHGERIITSYVRGVNAWIEQTEQDPSLLPLELRLLDIKPGKWTPDIVVSRHQGLLGNIGNELDLARLVIKAGPEQVKKWTWLHPNDPDLDIDPRIDRELLSKDILELYNAFRRPVAFKPEDLVAEVRNPDEEAYRYLAARDAAALETAQKDRTIGSNNWVVSGALTATGYPIMANDPHRVQAVPSLRYMAHLVGPGWNVIGGGEPEIPGISIGHNEYGAWGLTVFSTDAEDLYAYETNPDNPDQYRYRGHWEDMVVIRDTVPVKGQQPVIVNLRYTRHGPVVFQDTDKNQAFAVRCGWLEVGASPYLASLRMDQARTWEEFREACRYSFIPGENMVWADREGHIGWQAVGIAPIRPNFSGLVPVWGNGDYEWDGYLPIKARPHTEDPPAGYIATANENVTPLDYEYKDALGYAWGDPFRGNRLREVLGSGRKHTLEDMAQLQTDYLSLPARALIPMLKAAAFKDPQVEKCRQMLLEWDLQMTPNSIPAGIYHAWEKILTDKVEKLVVPEEFRESASLQMWKTIETLTLPDGRFGKEPVEARNELVATALEEAVASLQKKLGKDMNQWMLGQAGYKHIRYRHPLSNAVKEDVRNKLEVGPAPRGGNSYTVNVTGSADNQTHGASFRIISDLSDWDRCLSTNTPGQSGDPDSPFYRNLFDIWAKDQYFPLFYSREKVESVEALKLELTPVK